MERLGLAMIGCGGMGHRHLTGQVELERAGLNPFELVAAVDMKRQNAESLADRAERDLGHRPVVFSELGELAAENPDLAAVDICTDPPSHHTIAIECLERGWHVMVEKPMGLTTTACDAIVRAADGSPGLVLSVAENYRRDPINRLAKALLDAEVIGTPRVLLHLVVGGGDSLVITPWRHQKNRSGVLLDVGVHFTDMIEYLLGPVGTVTAQMRLHEPVRRGGGSAPSTIYGELHGRAPDIEPTAEDACYALLQFESGIVGQFVEDHAGHGEGVWQRVVYGSRGSMSLPGDRSGRPIRMSLDGRDTIEGEDLLELVPDFHLDDAATRLFGRERLGQYDFPFPETDAKIMALEYAELGQCIRTGGQPEVDSRVGARAVALCYSMLESATAGRSITVEECASGEVHAYQQEIDVAIGLP